MAEDLPRLWKLLQLSRLSKSRLRLRIRSRRRTIERPRSRLWSLLLRSVLVSLPHRMVGKSLILPTPRSTKCTGTLSTLRIRESSSSKAEMESRTEKAACSLLLRKLAIRSCHRRITSCLITWERACWPWLIWPMTSNSSNFSIGRWLGAWRSFLKSWIVKRLLTVCRKEISLMLLMLKYGR